MTLQERIEAKLQMTPTGCWLWTGGTRANGYGEIKVNRKNVSVHRIAYQIYKGEIPKNLCVLHTCDIRNCVNPDHLWLGTHKENTQDMFRKGRHSSPSGEKHYQRKLTWEFVQEIRELKGKVTQTELAKRYGVNKSTISEVQLNKIWRSKND